MLGSDEAGRVAPIAMPVPGVGSKVAVAGCRPGREDDYTPQATIVQRNIVTSKLSVNNITLKHS